MLLLLKDRKVFAHSKMLTAQYFVPRTLAVTEVTEVTGVTGGLVKGALSVAASAYKALLTGQNPTQVRNHLNPESASTLLLM